MWILLERGTKTKQKKESHCTAVGQDARHCPVVKVLPGSPQGEEALWALPDEVVGVNCPGSLESAP